MTDYELQVLDYLAWFQSNVNVITPYEYFMIISNSLILAFLTFYVFFTIMRR